MSIEQNLERIANALESIASSINQAGNTGVSSTTVAVETPKKPAPVKKTVTVPVGMGAPSDETPGAGKPGKPVPTLDDLTDALRDVVTVKGAPVAKAILAKYGADRISAVKPEHYQQVFDEFTKAKAA